MLFSAPTLATSSACISCLHNRRTLDTHQGDDSSSIYSVIPCSCKIPKTDLITLSTSDFVESILQLIRSSTLHPLRSSTLHPPISWKSCSLIAHHVIFNTFTSFTNSMLPRSCTLQHPHTIFSAYMICLIILQRSLDAYDLLQLRVLFWSLCNLSRFLILLRCSISSAPLPHYHSNKQTYLLLKSSAASNATACHRNDITRRRTLCYEKFVIQIISTHPTSICELVPCFRIH